MTYSIFEVYKIKIGEVINPLFENGGTPTVINNDHNYL